MTTVKPILFSGPMIRAILEGRKTQTRRIIKPQPEIKHGSLMFNGTAYPEDDTGSLLKFCPYGQTGGALWVREHWGYHGMGQSSTDRWKTKNMGITYHADNRRTSGLDCDGADLLKLPADYPVGKVVTMPDDQTDEECHAWWQRKKSIPSIHMPRWANRITLEVKDIRVERLQDISETDAEAEGVKKLIGYGISDAKLWAGAFANLWIDINGKESWYEDPWVWVVEFEAHQCNIDDYLKQERK